jgi:hypothetical protein
MVVHRVHVSPGSIGLPHLHEGVTYGAPVAVDDTAADDDPFAKRLSVVLPRQVGVLGEYRDTPKHWAGQLVKPFRGKPDELSSRRPPDGCAVVRVQVRRFAVAV